MFLLTCACMWSLHALSCQTLPCHTQDPDKEEAPELAIDDMDDEPIIIEVKDPNHVRMQSCNPIPSWLNISCQ